MDISLQIRENQETYLIEQCSVQTNSGMDEIQPEKKEGNISRLKILHDIEVAVRRPNSTSVNNVNLGTY